jgi:hypothetical protein
MTILAAGCHQVTEFQSSDSSSLVFISTGDLQVTHVIGGIEGGRTLVPNGSGEVLAITSQGILYRIDIETVEVDTSYSIGGSSGTGYGDAVIASNGNLYVLGPGSQVIEVNLGSNTVEDNFAPGSSPVALAASPTLDRVYFIDQAENSIGEILTLNNHTGFTSNAYYPLADLIVEPTGGEFIMSVCSDGQGRMYSIWLDYSTYIRQVPLLLKDPCSAIIPMTSDSIFAVCCPRWSDQSGTVHMIKGYAVPYEIWSVSATGHPIAMCFNGNSGTDGFLSVLGRTDSGSTALSVFSLDPYHVDLRLEGEIALGGIPRDVVSPGPGDYIVVLTSQ